MNEILLQASPQDINNIVFGVKDLITIGGGIVATVTAYLTLKFTLDAFKTATEKEFTDIKSVSDEKFLAVKHGKNAIKKELEEKIVDLKEMSMARIDKTQERMEGFQKDNQVEFKEINGKLNKILGLLENK